MATLLNGAEYRVFEELKRQRAIRRLQQGMFFGENMIGVFICGDGHHSEDKFLHFGQFARQQHLFSANGGFALLDPELELPKKSSFQMEAIRDFWIDQMLDAIALKDIHVFFGKVHFPCGILTKTLGMGPEETIASGLRARKYAEARLRTEAKMLVSNGRDVSVELGIHIANGQERRTWSIDPSHRALVHLG